MLDFNNKTKKCEYGTRQRNVTTSFSDNRKKTSWHVILLDLCLNGFIFTPLVICNWASIYDLSDTYVLPEQKLLSQLLSFAFGQAILIVLYFLQNTLQNLHNNINRNKKDSFYANGYTLRIIYTYALFIAYSCQWRSVWDIYAIFIDRAPFYYQFSISIIGLFLWCFLLKRSLSPFSQVIPFTIYPDHKFEAYFLQANKIVFKESRQLEILLNYLNNEFIELIIGIMILKGIWEMFEVHLRNNESLIPIFILVGYAIYFCLNIFQYLIVNILKNNRKCLNVAYLIAYFTLVLLWVSITQLYDVNVYRYEYPFLVLCTTHVACVSLMVLFNLTTALLAFGGSDDSNSHPSHFKLFKIEYIDYFRKKKEELLLLEV